MSGKIDKRLAQLGIELPPPPEPAASYVPFVRQDQFIQLSGVAPKEHGRYVMIGKVGRDLTLADGQRAARICAMNILANLRLACAGDLDRVRRFIMVRGFVNAAESFEQVPEVMNGASDLIIDVFGPEIGRHARTSIGCATLPNRVSVEIDALVAVDPKAR